MNRRTILITFVCAMAFALSLGDDTVAQGRRGGQTGVPASAKVSLVFDKAEYFLGENILMHFVVENAGQENFSIEMGGDYRGAARSLRFKVTAVDQDGKAAADPNPSTHNFGGLSHTPELKPGEKYHSTLQLRSYRRLENSGVYTIRVAHDLGWRETDERKAPVAEATIKVVMPDAQQARKVVEEMYRLPQGNGVSVGQKHYLYADFGALSYPVYLQWLTPRAAAGDEEALGAIGVIATPEATQALIDLARHKDAKFARSALQTLNHRLPDPQLDGKLGRRNPFFDDLAVPRRRLIDHAWKPEFAPAVRKLGSELIQENDLQGLKIGGYILQCLGEKDDLKALIRGIELAAAHARANPPEEGIYPRPRGACMEMRRAADAMVQRGIEPPLPPRSGGERVLFALAIKQRNDFRPDGWLATYAALLQDGFPFVRQVGLDCLPDAPDPAIVQFLPKLLLDPDVDVQISACQVAAKVKTPELREPLIRVLKNAREHWLVYSAVNAADAGLVSRIEKVRILVERLDEEGMSDECLNHLCSLVKSYSGRMGPVPLTGDQAKACKKAWQTFVREREMEIAQGQTYAAGDPNVPIRDLFPKTEFYAAKSK